VSYQDRPRRGGNRRTAQAYRHTPRLTARFKYPIAAQKKAMEQGASLEMETKNKGRESVFPPEKSFQ
jgi:hypothetical protein